MPVLLKALEAARVHNVDAKKYAVVNEVQLANAEPLMLVTLEKLTVVNEEQL